jgi:hypothetical protein
MIAPMLSRREIPLLNGTGIPEAAVALKEELRSFPAAKPAFRVAVSGQFVAPFPMIPFIQYCE